MRRKQRVNFASCVLSLVAIAGCTLFTDFDGLTTGASPGPEDGGDHAEAALTDVLATTSDGTPGGDGASTVTARPPSCVGSAAGAGMTCGPTGTTDCCASPKVPGGSFARSYDGVNGDYLSEQFAATISEFRLDTYEITVGRFRAFVASYPGSKPSVGAGKNPKNASDKGWDATWNAQLPGDQAALLSVLNCLNPTWTNAPASNETKAMNCITWYEAFAFCIWDGGRLPSEAEWNYAAAGGGTSATDGQRTYPWSSPPSSATVGPTYAVFNPSGTAQFSVSAVGSKSTLGDGKWGHADLGGNVWEWTLDMRHEPYAINPCNDCADLTPATDRVIRGGSWNTTTATLLSSFRSSAVPAFRGYDVGVRCARP